MYYAVQAKFTGVPLLLFTYLRWGVGVPTDEILQVNLQVKILLLYKNLAHTVTGKPTKVNPLGTSCTAPEGS